MNNRNHSKADIEKLDINDADKLNIILTEYQTLKDEEKTIYSFEFTCLSIWLTFLAAIIGVTFSLYGNLYNSITEIAGDPLKFDTILKDISQFQSIRNIISVVFTILLPGTCSFFGLLYLDLTCRFIKEAHYLWIMENNLKKRLNNQMFMGFETYVLENSNKKSRGLFFLRTNYLMYCFILGVLILCPVLVLGMMSTWKGIIPWISFHFWIVDIPFQFFFWVLEIFTFLYCCLYLHEILSYAREKDSLSKSETRNENETDEHESGKNEKGTVTK